MRECSLLICLIAVFAACAAGGSSQGTKSSSSLITAEEIAETSATNALEAIELLRPNLLSYRGSRGHNTINPVVYLNNIRYGDLPSLQNINVVTIKEIKFLKPNDATLLFGTNHMGGAFVITSREQ